MFPFVYKNTFNAHKMHFPLAAFFFVFYSRHFLFSKWMIPYRVDLNHTFLRINGASNWFEREKSFGFFRKWFKGVGENVMKSWRVYSSHMHNVNRKRQGELFVLLFINDLTPKEYYFVTCLSTSLIICILHPQAVY